MAEEVNQVQESVANVDNEGYVDYSFKRIPNHYFHFFNFFFFNNLYIAECKMTQLTQKSPLQLQHRQHLPSGISFLKTFQTTLKGGRCKEIQNSFVIFLLPKSSFLSSVSLTSNLPL